jgi:DNA repair protein RecN (Recombination protein N)
MLSSVHIENIALIKNIDISFGSGFNVLTGETGAGKSIIIDALSLLCGARGDKDIIRTGETTALVEGIFSDLGDETLEALAKNDVYPDEDGLLFIQRKLTADGKTTAKIGSRQVPASKLKELSPLLLTIHGQQDTQILADESKQLSLLDGFAGNDAILKDYKAEYEKYTSLIEKQNSLKTAEEEKTFRLDMLNYRLNEIEKARLTPGEEESLTAEKILLSNSEKIITHSNEVYDYIYRAQGSASERLSLAANSLRQLSGIIPEADNLTERIENARYELEDIAETIRSYIEQDGVDPVKRLDIIEGRLEQINSLKRKYKSDVAGILKEYERLKEEKESIEYTSELLEKIDKEIEKQKALLTEKAAALTVRGKKRRRR